MASKSVPSDDRPILVFTQGDPTGIGPEILLRVAAEPSTARLCRPLLILERAAIRAIEGSVEGFDPGRFHFLERRSPDLRSRILALPEGEVAVLDPLADSDPPEESRRVVPGQPGADDARGAMAALDLGIDLVQEGAGAALVTAPINKAEIARHLVPDFRGHTDYLAEKAGLREYGRDYLMAFLTPDLRVALLSTHISLQEALDRVTEERVLDALRCLGRNARGRIAVAGLDPHAGEGGLIGTVDDRVVRPAVEKARAEGIDAHGPESADSLFSRARQGRFDWVLALYHDQGLIPVKTIAFGESTNVTLGLPFLRTSVDHGTAYDIAGRGVADPSSLRAVVGATLELVIERVI